jgi:hypothetical protein
MMANRGKQMLGTSVTGMEYNFQSRAGRLYMDRGCCCDMTDCINYFRRIDPDVTSIRTFAGIEDDTAYVLRPGNQWEAIHKGEKWGPQVIPDPEAA